MISLSVPITREMPSAHQRRKEGEFVFKRKLKNKSSWSESRCCGRAPGAWTSQSIQHPPRRPLVAMVTAQQLTGCTTLSRQRTVITQRDLGSWTSFREHAVPSSATRTQACSPSSCSDDRDRRSVDKALPDGPGSLHGPTLGAQDLGSRY